MASAEDERVTPCFASTHAKTKFWYSLYILAFEKLNNFFGKSICNYFEKSKSIQVNRNLF